MGGVISFIPNVPFHCPSLLSLPMCPFTAPLFFHSPCALSLPPLFFHCPCSGSIQGSQEGEVQWMSCGGGCFGKGGLVNCGPSSCGSTQGCQEELLCSSKEALGRLDSFFGVPYSFVKKNSCVAQKRRWAGWTPFLGIHTALSRIIPV